MIRWPWRRHCLGTPDIEAFFTELARAYPGKGRYEKMDRYRDFRAVFQNSAQGRRVLHEILMWCHMGQASAPQARFQTNETFFLDGERNIGAKLIVVMNAEPKERPKSMKEA